MSSDNIIITIDGMKAGLVLGGSNDKLSEHTLTEECSTTVVLKLVCSRVGLENQSVVSSNFINNSMRQKLHP